MGALLGLVFFYVFNEVNGSKKEKEGKVDEIDVIYHQRKTLAQETDDSCFLSFFLEEALQLVCDCCFSTTGIAAKDYKWPRER